MTTPKLHPAYIPGATALGLPLDTDSRACRCWVVAMLGEWRATSPRFVPQSRKEHGLEYMGPEHFSQRPMTHDDHRAFAKWMEQAS